MLRLTLRRDVVKLKTMTHNKEDNNYGTESI